MQASIIQPIVALLGLILQLIFGVRLAEEQLEVITNGIVAITLAIVTVISGYKAFKEKKK